MTVYVNPAAFNHVESDLLETMGRHMQRGNERMLRNLYEDCVGIRVNEHVPPTYEQFVQYLRNIR